MPPVESFCDATSFYATLAHEATHWTKHPSRLQCDFGRKSWGDAGYATKNSSANSELHFFAQTSNLRLKSEKTTPPTSQPG